MARRSWNRSDDNPVTFGRLPETTAAVILAMNSGLGMFSCTTVMSGWAAAKSFMTSSSPANSDWLVKVCQ